MFGAGVLLIGKKKLELIFFFFHCSGIFIFIFYSGCLHVFLAVIF